MHNYYPFSTCPALCIPLDFVICTKVNLFMKKPLALYATIWYNYSKF